MDTEIRSKLMNYCAYQERCKNDVINKLYKLGIENNVEQEEYIDCLINDKFLNEKRYLNAYCRGKFRINKWGRLKMRYNLRAKGFSDSDIDKALREEIDEDEYKQTIQMLLEKRSKQSLIALGYESELLP